MTFPEPLWLWVFWPTSRPAGNGISEIVAYTSDADARRRGSKLTRSITSPIQRIPSVNLSKRTRLCKSPPLGISRKCGRPVPTGKVSTGESGNPTVNFFAQPRPFRQVNGQIPLPGAGDTSCKLTSPPSRAGAARVSYDALPCTKSSQNSHRLFQNTCSRKGRFLADLGLGGTPQKMVNR